MAEPGLTPTELASIVRGVDPSAFVVPGRVIRRAIKHDRDLPKLTLHVPHRRVFVIRASSAMEVVDRDELGLESDEELPSLLILIAGPDADESDDRPRGEILRECWRRLFHAHVHLAIDRKFADGSIDPAGLRDRLGRLGPSVIEEARSVLLQEEYLPPPHDDASTYVEFAAVYLELRTFAEGLIPTYFPAIRDREAVDRVLAEDVDAETLLAETRVPGAIEPSAPCYRVPEEAPAPEPAIGPEAPSSPRYRRLLAEADRVAERGNLVRAAILRTQAARLAGSSRAGQARSLARKALDQLAGRLKAALDRDEDDLREWRKAIESPLDRGSRGFWRPEARLLYDLQKVCLDHEKAIYKVDLVEWARTLGRRPIKRLLPSHREVLMVQHLRGAAKHLTAAKLDPVDRLRLTGLLKRAIHHAEGKLRDRLRPEIARALEATGFGARNLTERVALQTLNEELLDRVVERGFLALGDFRDAVSRNDRKLPDLAGPFEFIKGDRLLKADERLAIAMDGVYRRGEVYLRVLQRLSALAFGTRTGRLLTRYVALPYLGTAVILKGLQEVAGPVSEWVIGDEMHLLNPVSLTIDGTLAIGLLYWKAYRVELGRYVMGGLHLLQVAVLGVPLWVLRRDLIRRLFVSREFSILWRGFLLPMAVTLAAWMVRPRPVETRAAVPAMILIFLTTSALLTTKAGRALEEMAVDSVGRAWNRLILGLLPGLFRLVMETFDRLLEGIERVLYTVDEWLRFRAGQTAASLWAKAILGVVWFFLTYVTRFVVTLLVEPQINPIKHFPVVTVSHKIMLTQAITLKTLMVGLLGVDRGLAVAGVILLLTPGIFGFLVWELKENWRLYEANRPKTLGPVAIGHHGETMARLLKPGFHSGTVPKLFARLRKANRKAMETGHAKAVRAQEVQLHGVEESVRHFLDRDFLTLLLQGRSMASTPLALGEIVLSSKRFLVELNRPGKPGPSLWLSFEEHSGWIVAGIADPGWLAELTPPERNALGTALVGLYKLAGVDLVREPIAAALGPDYPDFDIREQGLVVYPDESTSTEILYLLRPKPGVPPLVTITSTLEPPALDTARLLFSGVDVTWQSWVDVWERDRSGVDHPAEFVDALPMLPEAVGQRLEAGDRG